MAETGQIVFNPSWMPSSGSVVVVSAAQILPGAGALSADLAATSQGPVLMLAGLRGIWHVTGAPVRAGRGEGSPGMSRAFLQGHGLHAESPGGGEHAGRPGFWPPADPGASVGVVGDQGAGPVRLAVPRVPDRDADVLESTTRSGRGVSGWTAVTGLRSCLWWTGSSGSRLCTRWWAEQKVLTKSFEQRRIQIAFRPGDQALEVADAAIVRDPEFIAGARRCGLPGTRRRSAASCSVWPRHAAATLMMLSRTSWRNR